MLKKFFNNLMKSPKTTIGAIIGVIVFIAGALGVEVMNIDSWGEIAGMIAVAAGLSMARDNDKTSEEANS